MAYGIEKEKSATLIVEKSRFIGYAFPLVSLEHAQDILSFLHKNHPDATHVCYAYRWATSSRSSDDGEPSGTAGRPLLELLNKRGLERTLLVVVRYYGGHKLGAGRLLRTYVETGQLVLETCRIGVYQTYWSGRIALPYAHLDEIKYALIEFHASLSDFVYNEKVEATLLGSLDAWETLFKRFPSLESLTAKVPTETLIFTEDS